MTSKIFQGIITQLKESTNRNIGVIDSDGLIIASADASYLGIRYSGVLNAIAMSGGALVHNEDKTFKVISMRGPHFEHAVFITGEDAIADSLCVMASVALSGAKSYYDEKFDKATFVKNIITDNVLPGDVYLRAKELKFGLDVPRAVFLIRQTEPSDIKMFDTLQSGFADSESDYVLSINETDSVLIKQVGEDTDDKQLYNYAVEMSEAIRRSCGEDVTIGIGTVANYLRELASAYKEAQVAIQVGKIFDTEKKIINYENLGIGRLIYQLPTTLCEMFLSEVFKKNSIDSLDQETLFTINKFFENNLNVSETSRKLFVHRNTLVYRLEKIKKLTGLDLREFDHAIIFKVALMVKKYLVSREGKQTL